jgi:hypothetical protein
VRVKLFLAGIAGADTTILREARSEQNRYAAMGAVIAMTAAMACVSAGFAMVMAMRVGLPAAIAVGLLWGTVVFNLDRLMVTQMVRQKARRSAFYQALPRVFIAVVLGAVISTPLVLQLFKPEIDRELQTMRQEAVDDYVARQNGGDLAKQIAGLQSRVDAEQKVISDSGTVDVSADPDVVSAKQAYDAVEAAYRTAYAAVICEIDGSCGTGKVGHGPAFQEKQRRSDDLKAQRDRALQTYQDTRARVQREITRRNGDRAQAARTQLEADQKQLAGLKSEQERGQQDYQLAARDDQGLLARLEALERLSGHRPLLLAAHLAVFLLFAAIELMPVLMKLLQTLGPETVYERLLRSREQEYEVEAQSRLWSHYESERIRGELSVRLEQHRARLAFEAGQAANAEVVRVQRGVLERLLGTWAEHTVGQVDTDLRRWREGGTAAVTGPIPAIPADDQRPATASDHAPRESWTASPFTATSAAGHHDWDTADRSRRDGAPDHAWATTVDADRTWPVGADRASPERGSRGRARHADPTTGPIVTARVVTPDVVDLSDAGS